MQEEEQKKEEKRQEKVKLAIYWGAACGGCDIAILRIDERLLDLAEIADIVFWPAALDYKHADLEKMEDKSIDLAIFNGAIRNSEDEHMAKILRDKSRLLVAYGSCACEGCVIGLANLSDRDEIFTRVYVDNSSTFNPEGVTPQPEVKVDGNELYLPTFADSVRALHQVVDVDYYVPGCPPEVELTEQLVDIVFNYASTGTGGLPPKGTVIAPNKILCEECPRKRGEKAINKLYRFHEIEPDHDLCLLDQGIICMGPATRAGCKARCVNVNIPCTGCMGAPEGIDQGTAMANALASVLGVGAEENEIEEIINQIKDPVGTFYLYSFPISILNRVKEKEKGVQE
ncbi:MAG: oxidoreductase [Archaeoglobaceae archaeon]